MVTAGSPRYTESTQGRLRRLNRAASLQPVVFAAVALLHTDARTG